MTKKPTIASIAEEAHVSIAAVSMILAEKNISRFSDDTIHLVQTIARQVGYQSKHLIDKGGLILIICPSVINPYYATLLQGMEKEADKAGYKTVICTTYWDKKREQDFLGMTMRPSVRGVIFSMVPQQPELVDEVAKHLPVVVVGDKQNETPLDTVEVNNYDAGFMLGEYLLSLGHRHICYVSTSLNKEHSSRVLRLEGLRASYQKKYPEGKIEVVTSDVDPKEELSTVEIEYKVGKKLTTTCIKSYPEVTAIVAINDMVAYGVLNEIKEEGFRIPDDYSVCGFDNIYPSQFSGVGLTTIDHFINRRGQSAFDLLRTKLENPSKEEEKGLSVTHVEFHNKLVIRSTTGKPRT